MSNDDQSRVDHMSLSGFIGESKANLVDDADNIQSGTHESSSYGRTLILIVLVEADLGSDRKRDSVVEAVAAIDQS